LTGLPGPDHDAWNLGDLALKHILRVQFCIAAMLASAACHAPDDKARPPQIEEGCQPQVLSVTAQRQNGPTCLVAAAMTAISARGGFPTLDSVVRRVPVWPDGVHAYDLSIELERRGWESLVFTGPPEIAARVVEAGFAPVAMIGRGRGRHAVTVTGVERGSTETGACGTALHRLRLTDPTSSQPKWVSAKAFAAMQSEGQMQVFFRPTERSLVAKNGFPMAVAQRFDRRFRATTLYRRSEKHEGTNPQRVKMLRAALAHDSCFEAARSALLRAVPAAAAELSALPPCDPP
jgi:hypothetical protein